MLLRKRLDLRCAGFFVCIIVTMNQHIFFSIRSNIRSPGHLRPEGATVFTTVANECSPPIDITITSQFPAPCFVPVWPIALESARLIELSCTLFDEWLLLSQHPGSCHKTTNILGPDNMRPGPIVGDSGFNTSLPVMKLLSHPWLGLLGKRIFVILEFIWVSNRWRQP